MAVTEHLRHTQLSDAELASLAQAGDALALGIVLSRYRRFARSKSRGYFLVGGDADDIEQEALIGLFKAVRDFRSEHGTPFRAFAELCVTRQIITAIKTATRQKHRPLNQYLSTSTSTLEGGGRLEEDLFAGMAASDPAEKVVSAERVALLRTLVADRLSEFEVEVLHLYVAGRSYHEIGERLDRDAKSVDNAIQRIRRKLEQHLRDEAADDPTAHLGLTA